MKEKDHNEDPTNGPVALHYYFGDWYRANSVFQYDTKRIVTEFPFRDSIARYFGNYPREEVTTLLDKLFNITFETDPHQFLERFDDLSLKINTYNDLRGKGRYIEYVIFPDWKTFEKYVALALRPYVERKMQKKNQEEKLRREAIKTGEEVVIAKYSVPCTFPLDEYNLEFVVEYFSPEGRRRTRRIPVY